MNVDIVPQDRIPKATDEKGHSVPITTRVPPVVINRIDVLLKNPETKYKNRGEIVRAALEFYFINHKGKDVVDAGIGFKLLIESQKRGQYRKLYHETLELLGKDVSYYLRNGDSLEAGKTVADFISWANIVQDGYWRRKLLKIVNEKYGHLLKDVPNAQLKPSEFQHEK